MSDARRYKVVRYFPDSPNVVVRRGLTLEQAQAHCQDDSTHGDIGEWFDGYEVEFPTATEQRERLESDARLREGVEAVERLVNPR